MKARSLLIFLIALSFVAWLSSARAAEIAGVGIQIDGKYVGGYAITRRKETRDELIAQFFKFPITFEREYKIPVDAGDPKLAVLEGKIHLLSNVRGDIEVMAKFTSLKIVKRDGKWFVDAESLKEALGKTGMKQVNLEY